MAAVVRTASMRPGSLLGDYPERDAESTGIDGIGDLDHPSRSRRPTALQRRALAHFVTAVHHASGGDRVGPNLENELLALRRGFTAQGLSDALIARSFAVVREVAGRALNMRHHDTQLMAGRVMMAGALAEMQTGEGKTLAATLPAATAALAGIPVHVITANDYLASRDAAAMGPVYRTLGLSVGSVTSDTPPERRRQAYARDITYTTSKQLAFDYLRDRIVMGRRRGRVQLQMERLATDDPRLDRLTLRGLCFAIVDEADSVLIDEARTPFVIAREVDAGPLEVTCRAALAASAELIDARDYRVDRPARSVTLTDTGRSRLAATEHKLPGGARQREALVTQGLSARLLFQRDRDYLVRDDTVQIIDRNTGRVLPDRSWERGLHQMIECKEGCAVTAPRETLASLTFQRLFPRYLRLAGMTGTAREVARELWSTYRLPTVAIATHKPCRRRVKPVQTARSAEAKFAAIVQAVIREHAAGRPVLVGTRTVEDSEILSGLLAAAGLDHAVLNARQDAGEAAIVARAGQAGQITVATNMAGRGTDIALGPGVNQAGGLHVILSEPNEARRLDRQLVGRCARQGEAGSCQTFVAPNDEIMTNFSSGFLRRLLLSGAGRDHRFTYIMSRLAIAAAQRRCEAHQRAVRSDLRKMQDTYDKLLAFAGPGI